MEPTVRWSLKVSKETDEALREHFGGSGGRKRDLSKARFEKLVTEAVANARKRR